MKSSVVIIFLKVIFEAIILIDAGQGISMYIEKHESCNWLHEIDQWLTFGQYPPKQISASSFNIPQITFSKNTTEPYDSRGLIFRGNYVVIAESKRIVVIEFGAAADGSVDHKSEPVTFMYNYMNYKTLTEVSYDPSVFMFNEPVYGFLTLFAVVSISFSHLEILCNVLRHCQGQSV